MADDLIRSRAAAFAVLVLSHGLNCAVALGLAAAAWQGQRLREAPAAIHAAPPPPATGGHGQR